MTQENEKEEVCSRCEGDGLIADTEDGEPWSMWARLKAGSDLAVRLRVVRPIKCPDCWEHV